MQVAPKGANRGRSVRTITPCASSERLGAARRRLALCLRGEIRLIGRSSYRATAIAFSVNPLDSNSRSACLKP